MKLLISNIKLPIDKATDDGISEAVNRYLHTKRNQVSDIVIRHKSIDARKKEDIRYIFTVEANVQNGEKFLDNKKYNNVSRIKRNEYIIPEKSSYSGRPVIIGAGPSGLFCAYLCICAGLKPIIFERGKSVEYRQTDIERFWCEGVLNPESNVQFGEGGAGTFSDGKLNTVVKDKNGRCTFVMETFVRFGAPVNILYDSKPHVGTDILVNVVKNMREYICENGGEIHFDAKVTDFVLSKGKIKAVIVNDEDEIEADRVVLAIGHSARDTFARLYELNVNMSSKSFAVGLRVEHPRTFINKTQYGYEDSPYLPTASYKLTAQSENGRGVYSFCMCPGGYVVNASSEAEHIAVNGMSYSGRNGNNSNTAIVVSVNPDDYDSDDALAGINFQRDLEHKAYIVGNGRIPCQSYGDFAIEVCAQNKMDVTQSGIRLKDAYPDYVPQIKGTYTESSLADIMPKSLNKSFVEGMSRFGRILKGYDAVDTIMSGIESRTSSPVRIWRNDNGESTNISGLYPCGEGAGYAGGITSAAMDGIYIAEQIINS